MNTYRNAKGFNFNWSNDTDNKLIIVLTTKAWFYITLFLNLIRLSVYQGPTAAYLIPILALSSLPEWKCPAHNQTGKLTDFTHLFST